MPPPLSGSIIGSTIASTTIASAGAEQVAQIEGFLSIEAKHHSIRTSCLLSCTVCPGKKAKSICVRLSLLTWGKPPDPSNLIHPAHYFETASSMRTSFLSLTSRIRPAKARAKQVTKRNSQTNVEVVSSTHYIIRINFIS